MERPFEAILNISYDSLKKSNENFIFNFNQIDKILVWIVGFSITAISLIVSNITDLNINYSPSIIKIVLIFLMNSIVFGILFRISALLYLNRYQSVMFFVEGAFSNRKMMPFDTDKKVYIDDIHQIYQKIKNDFDEDYSDIVELYNNENQSNEFKKNHIEYLNQEYYRLTEWSSNEYKIANEYVKEVFQKTFDISRKKIDKLFKDKNHSFYLKLWSKISIFSLFISILSFLIVILLLALKY